MNKFKSKFQDMMGTKSKELTLNSSRGGLYNTNGAHTMNSYRGPAGTGRKATPLELNDDFEG